MFVVLVGQISSLVSHHRFVSCANQWLSCFQQLFRSLTSVRFVHISSTSWHILIKAYYISTRFTHFQVTFQEAGICIPPLSLRGRRANGHLLVMFNAWTSQRLMKFSLPVGHNCKHLKSTSVRHLVALFEITTSHITERPRKQESEARVLIWRRTRFVRGRLITKILHLSERVTHLHIAVPTKTRFYASRIHVLKNQQLLSSLWQRANTQIISYPNHSRW